MSNKDFLRSLPPETVDKIYALIDEAAEDGYQTGYESGYADGQESCVYEQQGWGQDY